MFFSGPGVISNRQGRQKLAFQSRYKAIDIVQTSQNRQGNNGMAFPDSVR